VAQVRASPSAMHEVPLPSGLVITGAHCVEVEVCCGLFWEETDVTHAGNMASCMFMLGYV